MGLFGIGDKKAEDKDDKGKAETAEAAAKRRSEEAKKAGAQARNDKAFAEAKAKREAAA